MATNIAETSVTIPGIVHGELASEGRGVMILNDDDDISLQS